MKEFIAEAGGRYTYSDDILNLQALALSMSAIFSECTPFIISGCEVEGATISSGYVWLGGKVRHFEGVQSTQLPYYIYERNTTESVVYANEVNKRGRAIFGCSGSTEIPTNIDPITCVAPTFITVTADYAPRLIDKFFGRYVLLINSPSQRQRVDKDVVFLGEVAVEKEIKSSKGVNVQHTNGTVLKAKVKDSGEISVGIYLAELLKAEIVVTGSGVFSFMKGDTELARIDENGFHCNTINATQIGVGKMILSQNQIANRSDNDDTGSIDINYTGYDGGITKFRDFKVFDGKRCSVPIFWVVGKTRTATVAGTFVVDSTSPISVLRNSGFAQSDVKLTATHYFQDKDSKTIAHIGFVSNSTHDLSIQNFIGNITLTPKDSVNIAGAVKLKGVDIYSIFTTSTLFTSELAKVVYKIEGKQLSTEDFTTAFKKKLESIAGSNLEAGGEGFVTAADVAEALRTKVSQTENLNDIMDKAAARTNLSIYSKSEGDARYLRISENLEELVALTADEINGMTQEEASALKAERQQAVRNVIKAEEQGIGATKLTKSLNLSDLTDKPQARKNISVYSVAEIDEMMAGKLNSDGAYTGAIFTTELKNKLDGIETGCFAYVDQYGESQAQRDGYILLTTLVKELKNYAPKLLDGYSSSDRVTIIGNLDLFTKTEMDSRYARLDSFFDDYIAKMRADGETTANAQKILRDKVGALATTDAASTYMRKDSKLTDLAIVSTEAQRTACNHIGAAHKDDYQLKQKDTGWKMMSNYGGGTDASRLFIRQIGNIVSIQGTINTARREGSHWGGVVAAIPNDIQPPAYGLRCSHASYNDDHKYNRGSSFVISAGSRHIILYESGWYGAEINLNFTYFV